MLKIFYANKHFSITEIVVMDSFFFKCFRILNNSDFCNAFAGKKVLKFSIKRMGFAKKFPSNFFFR